MKYCHNCGRMTLGEPLFCNFCGRSFDLKLCPRLHPNPRAAQICSQCGSRDLSTPQPHIPFWLKPFTGLLTIFAGVLLWGCTVLFLVVFVYEMLVNPAMQMTLMFTGLLFAGLWWLYLQLPSVVRRSVQKRIRRRDKR